MPIASHFRGSAPVRVLLAFCALVAGLPLAAGCSRPAYDASTPEALLDSIQVAVREGRLEDLPGFLEIAARDIEFDDGVTEASAIGDVKGKLSDMLGQLGRVSSKLKARFGGEERKAKTEEIGRAHV